MVAIIANGLHPCVLGSRILGGYALKGGMPLWKYVSNRCLTLVENLLLGAKLSEYHTGYRAFSREVLERLSLADNSDGFVFDNQMLAQVLWHGFTIAEVRPVRQGISPRHPRSASGAALVTVSAVSGRGCAFGWPRWAWQGAGCFLRKPLQERT